MKLLTEIKSSADRLGPPDVPPVYHNGVAYSQGDDGPGGILMVSDEDTGKPPWTLKVYDVDIDEALEADVQWVFFRSMDFDSDGRLRIVNEAGKAFLVDVKKRTVTPAPRMQGEAYPSLVSGQEAMHAARALWLRASRRTQDMGACPRSHARLNRR